MSTRYTEDLKIHNVQPIEVYLNTSVSIFGTGFEDQPRVFLDGSEVLESDITLINDNQINFQMPSAIDLGLKKIKVQVGQRESNTFQIKVIDLTIVRVEPESGPRNISVSIFGTGFEDQPRVFLDGSDTTLDIILINEKRINIKVPPAYFCGSKTVKSQGWSKGEQYLPI